MERELGIDFGTTTSEVSYVDKNGYSQTLMLQNSKYAIPTALYYNQEKEYVIGYDAVKKGKKNPGALVRNFKLDLTQNVKLHIEPETGDSFDVKPVKAISENCEYTDVEKERDGEILEVASKAYQLDYMTENGKCPYIVEGSFLIGKGK